jgi:hypothetical protein
MPTPCTVCTSKFWVYAECEKDLAGENPHQTSSVFFDQNTSSIGVLQ